MRRRSFFYVALSPLAQHLLHSQESAGELPFRQIHLDFHTSELIPDIAADWDAANFLNTLKSARVNSINVFAKCHHGLVYYDTRIALKHPALKVDLLGDMLRVCRPAGIAVNYYYSLVWDVAMARKHPEWLALGRDGKPTGGPPTDQWPWLCMNTPYLDQVVEENREILTRYTVDGAWFDILKQLPDGCFCKWCIADRRSLAISDSAEDIFRHNKLVAKRVEEALTGLVRGRFPKAATFFNSRLVIGVRDELPYYSHIEIESLPTGGWGYSHFEQRVRYMRTLGKDVVGMTGRFHKSWGDFGGLKNQAALDFECLNFLANGTKVCVGDQLHPRGRLDRTTYERIGKTYARVEALEPWAKGARAVTDIGVISSAATNPDMTTQKLPVIDQGFTNMLLELHQQFDVIDGGSDFSQYRVIIVPDDIRPVPEIVAKLETHLRRGGGMIVSNRSLLAGNRFAMDELGVRYLGPAKYKGEYMVVRPGAFGEVEDVPYFLYQQGVSIAAETGTEVLATYAHPYFDRSPEQFSSHKQTPPGPDTGEPLITRRGNAIYIANPFFRSYAQDAYGIQKRLVGRMLNMLLPSPAVVAPGLPSTARLTLLRQPSGRLIVHVLYYPLTRRAPDIDIIEEAGLLANVDLRVRWNRRPTRVLQVPGGGPLPFDYAGSYVTFRLPWISGHQAVAIEQN
jgi:hypothetical protein